MLWLRLLKVRGRIASLSGGSCCRRPTTLLFGIARCESVGGRFSSSLARVRSVL